MNALIYKKQPGYKITENIDRKTIGDIFAASLIGIYTLCALVISFWSAVILFTGNTSNGGPIGFIFDKVMVSGIF